MSVITLRITSHRMISWTNLNHPDDVHMETVHMRKERFLKSRGIDLYMNKMINEVVLVNIRYVDTTEMVVDGMSRFCCL